MDRKQKFDVIIDQIFEIVDCETDKIVEINGPHDYSVVLGDLSQRGIEELYELLEELLDGEEEDTDKTYRNDAQIGSEYWSKGL